MPPPASRSACFYLDMFPREGKFNHFAEFEIIGGKLLPDGKYQRPTVALLCNFPPPSADKPSLMTHQRRGDAFPRIRPRAACDRDPRKIWPFCRNQCAGRFRRGAFADAAKLGLGQEGARYFRGRLPRSVEENSGGDHQENERRKARHRRRVLSAAVCFRFARSRAARSASGK